MNLHHPLSSGADESGATAAEYGLLVAGIASVVVLLVIALGGLIADSFQTTCSTVKAGGPPSGQTC